MTTVQALAPGDQGEQVQELQRRLTHLGYYQGGVDGDYGQSTEEAVRQFQAAYGKTEDGAAGTETLETLDAEAQSSGYDPDGGQEATYQESEQDAGELGGIQVGQLSEDGLWQWDGAEWKAVESQTQDQPTSNGETSEAAAEQQSQMTASMFEQIVAQSMQEHGEQSA